MKQHQIKIFEKDGTTEIDTLNEGEYKNKISFNFQINSGVGELALRLNKSFFEYDEGTLIKPRNIVQVTAFDKDNKEGRLIWKGFISQYNPVWQNNIQELEVKCLGLTSLLMFEEFKNGSDYTVSYAGATDIAQIFKDIIDHWQSVTGYNYIFYGTDIDNTGVTPTEDYTKLKHLEAIKKAFEGIGGGWYWLIKPTGELILKEKPTEATHIFKFGRNVEGKTEKDSEKIINFVRIEYDGGDYETSDSTSISNYGKRTQIISDISIKNATTAQKKAEQIINDNNEIKEKSNIRLWGKNDEDTETLGYDIENVYPGDTCKIINTPIDNQAFNNNMFITQTGYKSEYLDINIDEFEQSVGQTLFANFQTK